MKRQTPEQQLTIALAINLTNEDKLKEVLTNLRLNIKGKSGSKGKSTFTSIMPKEENLTPLKVSRNKKTLLENTINDVLLSPKLNPLEGPTMLSCGKLGLGPRSRLPALERGRGLC
jgi:hypothetical protein